MKTKTQRVRLVLAAVIIGVAFSACNAVTSASSAPSPASASPVQPASRG